MIIAPTSLFKSRQQRSSKSCLGILFQAELGLLYHQALEIHSGWLLGALVQIPGPSLLSVSPEGWRREGKVMPLCRWGSHGKEGEEEALVDKGRRKVALLIEGYPLLKIMTSTGMSPLRLGPGQSLLWHRKMGQRSWTVCRWPWEGLGWGKLPLGLISLCKRKNLLLSESNERWS